MKFRYFSIFIVILSMFAVSVMGCGQAQQADSDVSDTLDSAKTKMAAGDYDGAYDDYLSALSSDPSNAEANFGAALLGLFCVVIDEDVCALVEQLGGPALPATLNDLVTSGFSTTGTSNAASPFAHVGAIVSPEVIPSEVQTVIENAIIPALDTILSRLANVESNSDFQFIITPAMSGADSNVEIDLGEIYALDLFASLLKGMLHVAISYDWDYTTDNPLAEENFGTLKANGAANMTAAMNAYIRAMNKWIAGINFIDAETDGQSDDIIPKYETEQDKDAVLDGINQVKNSLEIGDTTIDYTSAVSIVVDLKDYYSSPIADWKDYLIEDTNSDGVLSADEFPVNYDFTLSGLLPELDSYDAWDTFQSSMPPGSGYEYETFTLLMLLLI